MAFYTITIRKRDINDGKLVNPSKRVLRKQIKKQHIKLKKVIPDITTEFSIEKDKGTNRYHAHLLIHTDNKKELFQRLLRFVSADKWTEQELGDVIGIKTDIYYVAYGKYGVVKIHKFPYDEKGWRAYLNKENPSEVLV